MTTIAAPALQTAVAHIVARILERPPSVDETSAPAGQSTPDSADSDAAPAERRDAERGGSTARDDAASRTADGRAATRASAARPASVILDALLSLANRAVPMDINSSQLLNLPSALRSSLPQLPAELLAKPQVIEAVVLRNTLLPNAPNQQANANPLSSATADLATGLPTHYRVALQWQNRVLQFISPQPLPTGRPVQLQVDARGQVTVLPNARLAVATALLTGNTAAATRSNESSNAARAWSLAPAQSATTTAAQLPAALSTPQQTLQQSLRETLPRQQALHTLVPLLQKLLAPNTRAQLPGPVAKQLTQLLQSLPKPAQLQTGDGLRRALQDSGSFLESRIARSATGAPADTPESVARIAQTDLKAQLATLLAAVRRLLPGDAAAAGANDADAAAPEELVYDPKLLNRRNAGAAPNGSEPDAADLQLMQLSKLLQSGLARIQMNQLDGAVSRHGGADPQPLVPAWVLELPLPHRHGHTDNLQLRIEQHDGQQAAQKRVQWNVQIAFDLHALGKIAAQLSIVEKNVAATVWAERAQTHHSVREQIDYLRAGLESVGVRVTEMQCRLGLPPERAALISQQLVDVHT